MQFERAQFSDRRLQLNRNKLAGFARQSRFDWRNFFQMFVVWGVLQHVARFVFA